MKACANCGHMEAADARFCGVCGAAFDAAGPTTAAAAPEDTATGWPQAPETVRSPAGQPTAVLPPVAEGGSQARRRRRWPTILAAVLLVMIVGGAVGALFGTGVLPPSHNLSDATFAEALNSKATRGLTRADARARADLAKPIGNRIEGDGATIAAYASQARSELAALTKLSDEQRRDLNVYERFLAANQQYGVELRQNASAATTSATVASAAAAAAAADRVAKTAVPKARHLPAPAVFNVPAGASAGNSHPGPAPGGLTRCDQNISVDSVTSCPFAENVFKAYARHYQFNGKQADVQVTAYSPVTGRPYGMDCFLNGSRTVACTGGKKAFVTFPFSAVANY